MRAGIINEHECSTSFYLLPTYTAFPPKEEGTCYVVA
jgi:hypothetical protein